MWKILQNAQEKMKEGHSVALITLVEAQGSTYRKPGAKMVVDQEGNYLGTISGGCLERDVAHHAQTVLTEKKNKIINYDLADDLVFGLGLGCGGSISLLIEWDIHFWLPLVLANQMAETVVIKQINSSNDSDTLQTLFVVQDGDIIWRNPNSSFKHKETEIFAYCSSAIKEKSPIYADFFQQGQQVRLFFDYIQPPQLLVIFGGGDDALPVAALGQQLNFEVTIIDFQPANLAHPRFTGCTKLLWTRNEQLLPQLTKNSFAVVMSHHVERDAQALEIFYKQDFQYIGLLGPKKRLVKLEDYFEKIDLNIIENDKRFFSPIGLDIGSETPEEIAVSILSEIIAVRNKTNGLHLRQKQGAIHHQNRSLN